MVDVTVGELFGVIWFTILITSSLLCLSYWFHERRVLLLKQQKDNPTEPEHPFRKEVPLFKEPERQPSMKDHELAQLTNELTSIAQLYGRTEQLRERISYCLKEHLGRDVTGGYFTGCRAMSGNSDFAGTTLLGLEKLRPGSSCDCPEGAGHKGASCLKPKV